MSKYSDIIKRLKAATGPDRELDFSIEKFNLGDLGYVVDHWDTAQRHSIVAHYTASIDAALELVERMLPGWGVKVDTCGQAVLYAGGKSDWYLEDASSPPLAILLALFCALEAQETN